MNKQTPKVQDKIYKVIEIIETYEQIPSKYLKSISDSDGLYEARIRLASLLLFRRGETGSPAFWVSKEEPKDAETRTEKGDEPNEGIF